MKECNETITVFNRLYDNDTGLDTWNPTVISGVSWDKKTDTAITDSGLKAAAKCTIRIPVDAEVSKSYVEPIYYSDPATTFTLTAGDVIIRGTCSECFNPAELKKRYPDMVTILGTTDNTRRPHGKHWRVVAE